MEGRKGHWELWRVGKGHWEMWRVGKGSFLPISFCLSRGRDGNLDGALEWREGGKLGLYDGFWPIPDCYFIPEIRGVLLVLFIEVSSFHGVLIRGRVAFRWGCRGGICPPLCSLLLPPKYFMLYM